MHTVHYNQRTANKNECKDTELNVCMWKYIHWVDLTLAYIFQQGKDTKINPMKKNFKLVISCSLPLNSARDKFKNTRLLSRSKKMDNVLSAKEQLAETKHSWKFVLSCLRTLCTLHAQTHAHSAFSKNTFTNPTVSTHRQYWLHG